MDSIERQHICKHLHRLIFLTRCTNKLLCILVAEKCLDSAEQFEINSIGIEGDKSLKLYQILQTRQNAYQTLLTALRKTKQSGSLNILQRLFKISKRRKCSANNNYNAVICRLRNKKRGAITPSNTRNDSLKQLPKFGKHGTVFSKTPEIKKYFTQTAYSTHYYQFIPPERKNENPEVRKYNPRKAQKFPVSKVVSYCLAAFLVIHLLLFSLFLLMNTRCNVV